MSIWEGNLLTADLIIMPRALRHGLSEEQIRHAWRNAIDFIRIDPDSGDGYYIKAIGFDASGRPVEISTRAGECGLIVYHANTPLSARAQREFGLDERGRKCLWFRMLN